MKQQLESELKTDKIFTKLLAFRKTVELLLARPNVILWTTGVTNIGQVNIPRVYGPYELESISFAPSMTAFGSSFIVAISNFDGKMMMNFLFSEPSISRETMEDLANDVLFSLTEACQREDFYFKDLLQKN